MIITQNEYLMLTETNGIVEISTFKTGYTLKDFEVITRQNPRLKLTHFASLKSALQSVTKVPIEIGYWLPNIVVEVSNDQMSASVVVNETMDYISANKEQLKQEIITEIEKKGIIYGVIEENLEKIEPTKSIIIAKGTMPIPGMDAVIIYLPKPERKPVIKEDGKANYYDMNFISEITAGTWLGEKTPAQVGVEGRTVFGTVIPATSGKDFPLKYDKKSAYEVEEIGKTVLRSKISGVLEHGKDGIGVNKHLPISGDVGLETGNLEFDGSITIRGTVASGFTVIASGDISIEGAEGVTAPKLIKSIDGDVYIRGGIFGLNKSIIEAGGSIFVKHVNEAILHAKNEINIGAYSVGSELTATSIILDERKGKLIGGVALAKSFIVTAISGNQLERKTELIVDAVDRLQSQLSLQSKAAKLKSLQEEIKTLEDKIDKLSMFLERLTTQQIAVYEETKQELVRRQAEAQHFDREIKINMEELKHAGHEYIQVTKEALPGTIIKIGHQSSLIQKPTNGRFIVENGRLNV